MDKISSARPVYVLAIVAAAVLTALAIGSGRAAALPAEESPPAAGAVTLPVQGVVEAVTAPVQGIAAEVTPPVQEVVEALPKPPTPAPQPRLPSLPAHPGAAAGEVAGQAAATVAGATQTDTATQGARAAQAAQAVRTAQAATAAAPSPIVEAANAAGAPAPAIEAAEAPTSAPPSRPAHPLPDAFVPAPTGDGSTSAPLPRWVAFVWPAVALTSPYLGHFAADWGRAISRLSAARPGAAEAAQGVAGIHASGGRAGSAGSSPSLFQRIPGDVAHAFSGNVPTSALTYLFLLALAVLAVAFAVHREMAAGRRERSR